MLQITQLQLVSTVKNNNDCEWDHMIFTSYNTWTGIFSSFKFLVWWLSSEAETNVVGYWVTVACTDWKTWLHYTRTAAAACQVAEVRSKWLCTNETNSSNNLWTQNFVLSAFCAVGLAVTKQKHTTIVIWTLKRVARNSRSSFCRSLTIHPPLDLPIRLFLQILCILFISPLRVSCPSNNRNTVCCPAPNVKLPIIQISSFSCCFAPYGPVTIAALCSADNHVRHKHTPIPTHTHTHTKQPTHTTTPQPQTHTHTTAHTHNKPTTTNTHTHTTAHTHTQQPPPTHTHTHTHA